MVKSIKKEDLENVVGVLSTVLEWNGDPVDLEADSTVVLTVGSVDLTYGDLLAALHTMQDLVRYKQIFIDG